jgi:hypothetical protein
MLVSLNQPVADIPTIVVTPQDHSALNQQAIQAITFMDGYFQHLSGPDVLSQFQHDYAGYISYFSKVKRKDEVLREKAGFVRRWPQRSYHPRQRSIQVACKILKGEHVCAVSGLVDFDCRSPERHAVSSGVAHFFAQIWFDGDHPEIIGENSAVVG